MVLHEDGENSAHFVDSFGFTGLPDFMRELEGVKEQEAEKTEPEELPDTSGHDVQKSEAEQSEPEQTEAEKSEPQTEQGEPEKSTETQELEDMDDGDEIIDLGDEKDQVLAEMKQSLVGRQDTSGHNVQ